MYLNTITIFVMCERVKRANFLPENVPHWPFIQIITIQVY